MHISETNRRGLIILAGIIIFAVVVCGWLPFAFLPSQNAAAAIPIIQVPGENVIYDWKPLGLDLASIFAVKEFNLLNTMIALFIVDAVVIGFALLAFRASKGWRNQIPGRFQALVEVIAGGIYGLCRSIGGEPGKRIFPLVATIFFFLLIANWMSIIPGVESVGLFHCAYPDTSGYAGTRINDGLYQLSNSAPLNGGTGVTLEDHVSCVENTGIGELHGHVLKEAEAAHLVEVHDGHAVMNVPANPGDQAILDQRVKDAEGNDTAEPVYKFHITPFVRAASTDLNLTVALALISFFTIQAFGFGYLKINYLQKFIPVHALGNAGKQPLGLMNLIVGPLELLSELSKIVSLSFRLFGNIFAGASLVAVMLFLVGSGIPMIFYGLELIVGFMQALVFAALTLVFASQATESHIGDEHGDH